MHAQKPKPDMRGSIQGSSRHYHAPDAAANNTTDMPRTFQSEFVHTARVHNKIIKGSKVIGIHEIQERMQSRSNLTVRSEQFLER